MKLRYFPLYIGLFTSLSCFAKEIDIAISDEPEVVDFVFSARVGADWVDTGGSQQTSVVQGFIPDKYIPSNTPFQAGYGIFAGRIWEAYKWRYQLGLSYDYLPPFTTKGDILEFDDPALGDLSYEYRIQHQRLGIELKSLYEMKECFPFIRLGIGIAWNKAYRYGEESSSITEIPRDPFDDTENVAFTWSIGAGIEKEIFEDVRLGLSYLYTDGGKAKLKSVNSDESLTTDHLSINQIILEISHIF